MEGHRAGSKAAEAGPKESPKTSLELAPEGPSFRVPLGSTSPALGSALQGLPFNR